MANIATGKLSWPLCPPTYLKVGRPLSLSLHQVVRLGSGKALFSFLQRSRNYHFWASSSGTKSTDLPVTHIRVSRPLSLSLYQVVRPGSEMALTGSSLLALKASGQPYPSHISRYGTLTTDSPVIHIRVSQPPHESERALLFTNFAACTTKIQNCLTV